MAAMADFPVTADRQGPDYAAASRAALEEALTAAGPGMPTLCAGWRTEHLAAHLALRDSSPTAPGLFLPPLAAVLERRTRALGDAHAGDRGYAELVARIGRGPLPAPADDGVRGRLRGLAARARGSRPGRAVAGRVQLLEFFVHTEDVRRAQDRWAPRILADDYADALFTRLHARAALLYRGEETGVVLVRRARAGSRTDNAPLTARRPGPDGVGVRVTGPAGELAMHAFGRRGAALVTQDRFDADPAEDGPGAA